MNERELMKRISTALGPESQEYQYVLGLAHFRDTIETAMETAKKGRFSDLFGNAKNGNKKVLFANSQWNSYENVRNYLAKDKAACEKYKGADLKYYIQSALLWSDKKNIMRTDRGWIAYIRDFMNRDIEQKGGVVLRKQDAKKAENVHVTQAAAYGKFLNH